MKLVFEIQLIAAAIMLAACPSDDSSSSAMADASTTDATSDAGESDAPGGDSSGEASRRIFGGEGLEEVEALLELQDGYLFVGRTASTFADSGPASDLWIVATDLDGREAWSTVYGVGGTLGDGATRVLPLSTGGFLVGGWTQVEVSGNGDDAWLIIVDPRGEQTSAQVIDVTRSDRLLDLAVEQTAEPDDLTARRIDRLRRCLSCAIIQRIGKAPVAGEPQPLGGLLLELRRSHSPQMAVTSVIDRVSIRPLEGPDEGTILCS